MRDLIVDGSTSLVDADFFSADRFDDAPEGHGAVADNV
jgi:hypothetical protein